MGMNNFSLGGAIYKLYVIAWQMLMLGFHYTANTTITFIGARKFRFEIYFNHGEGFSYSTHARYDHCLQSEPPSIIIRTITKIKKPIAIVAKIIQRTGNSLMLYATL